LILTILPCVLPHFARLGRDPQPQSRESGEVPQLTVVHATPYMTGQARDPSVPSVLSPRLHAVGPLNTVTIVVRKLPVVRETLHMTERTSGSVSSVDFVARVARPRWLTGPQSWPRRPCSARCRQGPWRRRSNGRCPWPWASISRCTRSRRRARSRRS